MNITALLAVTLLLPRVLLAQDSPKASSPNGFPAKDVRVTGTGRPSAGGPVYPLKVSTNGRYLVDWSDVPLGIGVGGHREHGPLGTGKDALAV